MQRLLLIPLAFSLALAAQEPTAPKTRPEATDHKETSSLDDVQRFLDACVKLPHGDRLAISVGGKSHEGRPLLLVKAALPGVPPMPHLRALVIGNIHAGEVEGKETLQALIRDIAEGGHADVLEACDLWFVPVYNPDGNEATSPKNRPGQNGPGITGRRPNGQGLDLNRDFVKAEAPETRFLLDLFRTVDPHLFVDLHTTNGSYHGYHLTYSPCLSPNQDRGLQRLSRTLLDDATAAMQKDGFAAFDYGNFETRDWDGGRAPESPENVRGWYTYDSRPRYGVNYFGLRNRIAILSEAYSYCDFATRIAATRSFVLGLLHGLVARAADVRAACLAADAAPLDHGGKLWFGHDTVFGDPESLPILVGEVDTVPAEGEGTERSVRKGDGKPETMPVFRRFRARALAAMPGGYAVLQPSPDALALLQRHGIEFEAITAPRTVRGARFEIRDKRRPKRPFQGHQELELTGAWGPLADVELPLGTLIVPARQRLSMLAAQLLEPLSDDGMSNWNFFDAATEATGYPVLRLGDD